MIIITGGAGFIGSALLWHLNKAGRYDIWLVDTIDHPQKEKNIERLRYERLVGISEFRELVASDQLPDCEAVVHLGAISATTASNAEALQDNNVHYSQELIGWCVKRGVRCLYASSGATYGDGSLGYSDSHALFDRLRPLNLYGKSKLEVDIWARDQGYLDRIVGLRYFNVFGPNENHKQEMRHIIGRNFQQAYKKGYIELYKSYRPGVADGEQKRDFIYIKDAVVATAFFLEHPEIGGVYNIGTGIARSWNDAAHALFSALGTATTIRYIDMPDSIRTHYQYFTRADITKLRQAGFNTAFLTLEAAIADYVKNYLLHQDAHLSL